MFKRLRAFLHWLRTGEGFVEPPEPPIVKVDVEPNINITLAKPVVLVPEDKFVQDASLRIVAGSIEVGGHPNVAAAVSRAIQLRDELRKQIHEHEV